MTRSNSLAVSILVACFVCFAPATNEVYILHTNNTNGALENCLCPGKSYGSLEKRVHYIRQWLSDHPNTLVLDAGDFLSATGNMLKDSIAFRAYEMIKYDAIGLGDQEFFRGVDFIKDLMETSHIPFVSTNLSKPEISNVHKEIVVERGGVSFGILSILDPGVFRFYPKKVSEAVEVAEYEDLLVEKMASLKDEVDVLVVLSHLGIDGDRELARQFPSIDVIVGSHTQSVMEEPKKVGNTIIVQAGKDGYYVGQLKLTFGESKNIESYVGELVAMDIVLPNDSIVVDMIVAYNRLSRLRLGKRVERIVPIPDSFIVTSPERCGKCHGSQLDHWATTGHAASFETLKHDHKEKTPECLACHTTGFGRDDGYLNYNITAGLKNVNCTECHYVPSGHFTDPISNLLDPLSEKRCVRCHDETNSPEFEFAEFVSQIRHPIMIAEETEPERVVLEESIPHKKENVQAEGELPSALPEDKKELIAEAIPEGMSRSTIHTVKRGDTLWSLGERYLKKGSRWSEIYEMNRETLNDPNLIRVGQKLKIPNLEKE